MQGIYDLKTPDTKFWIMVNYCTQFLNISWCDNAVRRFDFLHRSGSNRSLKKRPSSKEVIQVNGLRIPRRDREELQTSGPYYDAEEIGNVGLSEQPTGG